MKLYRYEHPKTKCGPFQHDIFFPGRRRMIRRLCCNVQMRPTPEFDGLSARSTRWHTKYACKSIKDLKFYFRRWNSKLVKLGYKIVEVHISESFTDAGISQMAYDDNRVYRKVWL